MQRRKTSRRCAAITALAVTLIGCAPRASEVPFADGYVVATTVPESEATRTAHEVTYRVRTSMCDSLVTGSGFAVGPHTLITNRHVVKDATAVEIDSWDARLIRISKVTISQENDLAVLHTVERLPKWLKVADAKVGERVWVIGYPNGGKIEVSRGDITSEVEADELQGRGEPAEVGKVWQISAKVQSGDSGGPLINDAGEAVGVVYGFGEKSKSGYAVKTDVLGALQKQPAIPIANTCTTIAP